MIHCPTSWSIPPTLGLGVFKEMQTLITLIWSLQLLHMYLSHSSMTVTCNADSNLPKEKERHRKMKDDQQKGRAGKKDK